MRLFLNFRLIPYHPVYFKKERELGQLFSRVIFTFVRI